VAAGRTISASFLNELDEKVFDLCMSISKTIYNLIPEKEARKEFQTNYGKISMSRDGGLGLGGGKIQRDALCTRGRQGKAPFSNRNLRWHPLVVAECKPSFAKPIEKIKISGQGESQILIFIIKNKDGKEIEYPADKVYEMDERFVALPEHWYPHITVLRTWSDTLWTQNSCVIPALEACEWWNAVETYALLGIAVAVEFFHADFYSIWSEVVKLLETQDINKSINLPTSDFPTKREDITRCPVCLLNISESLNRFRKTERCRTWQPAWRSSKKEEGDDSSVQLMHVIPLVESKINHTANNVRYGHRWCNIAMTDHSLDETLDFMEFVINAHKKARI